MVIFCLLVNTFATPGIETYLPSPIGPSTRYRHHSQARGSYQQQIGPSPIIKGVFTTHLVPDTVYRRLVQTFRRSFPSYQKSKPVF